MRPRCRLAALLVLAMVLGGCLGRGAVPVPGAPVPPGPEPPAGNSPVPVPSLIAPPSQIPLSPAAGGRLLDGSPLPAVSPGGEFLLGMAGSHLWLFSLPGLEEQRGFDLGGAIPANWRWSPRGDAFALAVEGPPAVYWGDTGGALVRLAEGRRAPLVWSDDGSYLLLSRPLAVIEPATGAIWESPLEEPVEIRRPLFAPDGRAVFFTLFDPWTGEDLWVWHWRGGEIRRLTVDGEACYPWGWWKGELVVEIGAISTGGGHGYGFGLLDANRWTVTVLERDPGRGWRLLSPVPGTDLVLGQTVHAFTGDDRRVLLYNLAAASARPAAEGVEWAVDAIPGPPGMVVLLLRPGDGPWRLAVYGVGSGALDDLVTSQAPLHLLGTVPGTVYYLEAVSGGWLLQRAPLP